MKKQDAYFFRLLAMAVLLCIVAGFDTVRKKTGTGSPNAASGSGRADLAL